MSDLYFILLSLIAALPKTLADVNGKGYRFKLDIGNPNIYCPKSGYVCSNKQVHFLCKKQLPGQQHLCKNFKLFEMNKNMIKIFVEGTNGIRNKVATDLGLANMNLVYWSDELANMATQYLKECIINYDPCMIIGEKQIRVGQNIVFYRGQMTDSWPGLMVRHWYLEFGHNVKTWRDYKRKHRSGLMHNLTNLIYPPTEHIGCGGARMYKGSFIICYYFPRYNYSTFPENFKFGSPCTQCSIERRTCSKTFVGLCGVDLEISAGTFSSLKFDLFLIVFLNVYKLVG